MMAPGRGDVEARGIVGYARDEINNNKTSSHTSYFLLRLILMRCAITHEVFCCCYFHFDYTIDDEGDESGC